MDVEKVAWKMQQKLIIGKKSQGSPCRKLSGGRSWSVNRYWRSGPEIVKVRLKKVEDTNSMSNP